MYPPHFTYIYINFKCNLRCSYCQFLLQDKDAFVKAPTMKLEDFNWILDKFKKDITTVALGGGEPTLHPEFSEIVRSVKSRRLRLKMSTNGTLIAETIEDLRYVDKISVSLNGLDYDSFKKATNGSRKQFNDIIDGIYLLRDSFIPFNLSFVLFEENLNEIDGILQFAREVRPSVLNLRPGNPHGSESWSPLILSSPAVQNFLKEILRKDDYPFSINLPVILNPDSEVFYRESCPLLWLKTYIGPTGDIAYCCHLEFDPKIGNIFDNYKFNSTNMILFRRAMLDHRFPEDCLYCHRRFLNSPSGAFDSKSREWVVPPIYEGIKQKM